MKLDKDIKSIQNIFELQKNEESRDFPFEIIFAIFIHLEVKSLMIASRVNKRWKQVSNETILWKKLCLEHKVSMNDDDAIRILHSSGIKNTNIWKRLFINHRKHEERNQILGKVLWKSYERNALNRFLNPNQNNSNNARLQLTYNGEFMPCAQCTVEKEMMEHLDFTVQESTVLNRNVFINNGRTLYGHEGYFVDSLGPQLVSSRASMILHTLADGCDHGTGLKNFTPKSLIIKSRSSRLSSLMHESLIGSAIGIQEITKNSLDLSELRLK